MTYTHAIWFSLYYMIYTILYDSNFSHSKTLSRVICDGNDYDILPLNDASGNLTVKEMEINSFVAQDGELRQVRIVLLIPTSCSEMRTKYCVLIASLIRGPVRDAPESSREPTS